MPSTSPPPGKRLERLVAAIHHAASSGAVVTWDDEIAGRQFDVTIRFTFGTYSYLTVIECKDYSSKVPVEKVDALVTKARDAKANKAVMVSSKGFQSGCFSVAERHDVQLLVLTESSAPGVEDIIARMVPGVNVFDVGFQQPGGGADFEFEDWGGRLSYLMEQSKVVFARDDSSKTPNQLIGEWLLSSPPLDPAEENDCLLPFPSGSQLLVPHEPARIVQCIRFKCRLIEVGVPKGPVLDNHVRAGLAERVELRDSKGNLHHTAQVSKLPLRFDSPLKEGKFYEQAALFNRYYCERISGDLVHWVLVESYQFGRLVQARFTQKLEYAAVYVEVVDEVILARLRQMLARMESGR